jgi:hypothetical protein
MLTRLLHDNKALATVESALVAGLLFLLTFGIVEFGYAFWQWNIAEKATQAGIQGAVISEPVAGEVAGWDCFDAGVPIGRSCTAAFGTITCDGATRSCSRGAFNSTRFDQIVSEMQALFPHIQPANVTIAYTDIGLGFAGRPSPIPLVTLRLQNMDYEFIAIGPFIGLTSIQMPDFQASMTAEDMNFCGIATPGSC